MPQAWYLYRPQSDAFDSALLKDPDGLVMRVYRLPFVGHSVLSRWSPVEVTKLSEGTVSGDFPALADYYLLPLVSERAWGALSSLIAPWVEALPVRAGREQLYLLNVLDTVDCIDRAHSEFEADEETGRITSIFRYSLLDQSLKGRVIVKTPRQSGAELLVSERFRGVVEGAGLRGLAFEPLPISSL